MDNLGRIGDSLSLTTESVEKELQQDFRIAAQSLANLFTRGKKATKKSYLAGKREALQDVLEFLQATLDHPLPTATTSTSNSINSIPTVGPLNVARLIDYICARQETLKAEEQEEENEETIPSRSHNIQSNTTTSSARNSISSQPSIPLPSTSSLSSSTTLNPNLRRRDTLPPCTSSAPSSPQRFSISSTSSNPIASTSAINNSFQTGINSTTTTPTPNSSSITSNSTINSIPFLPTTTSSTINNTSSALLIPSSPLSMSMTNIFNSTSNNSTPSIGTISSNRKSHHHLNSRKGKNTTSTSSSSRSHSSASESMDLSHTNEHGVLINSTGTVEVSEENGPSNETLLGSMKRRYNYSNQLHLHSSIANNDVVDLSSADSVMIASGGTGVRSGNEEGVKLDGVIGGEEDQVMDFMENWDGTSERPNKRVSRR